MSSVSLSVGVTLGVDTAGHPTLSATGCNIGIGHLDVKFHGGARYVATNYYSLAIFSHGFNS